MLVQHVFIKEPFTFGQHRFISNAKGQLNFIDIQATDSRPRHYGRRLRLARDVLPGRINTIFTTTRMLVNVTWIAPFVELTVNSAQIISYTPPGLNLDINSKLYGRTADARGLLLCRSWDVYWTIIDLFKVSPV